MTKGYKK